MSGFVLHHPNTGDDADDDDRSLIPSDRAAVTEFEGLNNEAIFIRNELKSLCAGSPTPKWSSLGKRNRLSGWHSETPTDAPTGRPSQTHDVQVQLVVITKSDFKQKSLPKGWLDCKK